MRGTWRSDPPPRPVWQRALGIALLVGVILLVLYGTQVKDEVKNLKIVVTSPSPSATTRH